MTPKERIILFLLASLNFTHFLDFMIMMPLDNYLIPVFGIKPKEFSFLVGVYSFAAFLSGIFASSFVDKFDRKKVLMIAYGGFMAGTFACGFAADYEFLMGARFLTGLFGGMIGAQVLSIVGDIFPYERRGAAMGAVMGGFAVAFALGVPLSLYLTNLMNWHVPFIMVGALALVLLPMTLYYLPEMKDHLLEKKSTDSKFDAFRKILKSPMQYWALVFTVLMMVGHFMIVPFINPYMEFNKGFSKNQTPLIYLVGGLATLLSAIVLGRLSDRYGKLPVFSVSLILSLFMVWAITNMPVMPFTAVLGFFAVWFILGTGRGVTAQAMVSNVVQADQRGSFMTFNSSMQHLGTFIATIIAGYIVVEDKAVTGKIKHFEWLGYLSIIILFCSFLLARYLFSSMDKTINEEPDIQDTSDLPVQSMASSEIQN
jgi:MFS transporter, DHA1 family, inner membrane transport protein